MSAEAATDDASSLPDMSLEPHEVDTGPAGDIVARPQAKSYDWATTGNTQRPSLHRAVTARCPVAILRLRATTGCGGPGTSALSGKSRS